MKPHLILLLLTLIACSRSGNQESAVSDSLAVDTTNAASVPDETVDNAPAAGDTSQLSFYYASKVEKLSQEEGTLYLVTIQTSQYEATSSVTWHFDESFAPRHFDQDWAAEGNEGSVELFVEDGSVVCATEDDGLQTIRWCKATGGTRKLLTENNQTTTELLPANFDAECNERLASFLNTLKQILKDGEISNPEESRYTIRIERPFEPGSEFMETVEVSIAKSVYDELMK